jgi:hypothetical protein
MPQKVLYGPGVHIRHDWQRWIRPDFARWIKPGVDPADVIPALARERAERQAAEERARAAADAELAAEIEHERRVLAALSEEMKEVNAEMARWRRRRADEEAKYSPDQPRVPAGNSRGGQWTDGSTGGSIARPMGSVDGGDPGGSSELTDLFQVTPAAPGTEGVQVAAEREGGYPVDLLEERELGGHAIEGHVTSRQSVVNAVQSSIDYARRNGDSTTDMRQSSFSSLEAANKLVNATISEHPDQVTRVVSGLSPKETLHSEFGSPTGFEAFARNENSRVILSDTYAVRVVIVPDGRIAKGFRVDTAFPTNLRR